MNKDMSHIFHRGKSAIVFCSAPSVYLIFVRATALLSVF